MSRTRVFVLLAGFEYKAAQDLEEHPFSFYSPKNSSLPFTEQPLPTPATCFGNKSIYQIVSTFEH